MNLPSFIVPIEVFLLFVRNPQNEYTVREIEELINITFNDSLSQGRIRQIVSGLVEHGYLKTEVKEISELRSVNVYGLVTIYPTDYEVSEETLIELKAV